MATCGLCSYVGGTCGSTLHNPANVECVPLRLCDKTIQAHLGSLNVRDGSLVSESQLILARAGTCVQNGPFAYNRLYAHVISKYLTILSRNI